ncbi:bifunctional metallophosphatase/5'-nucleotidase [Cumulibacter soli]|uniref:bifunctional metallophosphatase/5'-nucleotidase n=1 Tax=Cumulibacter soli TaxID=2546344 RepID=UPI00106776EB|nr:5'-nucleotidase C-terminal domain-containing protein [Cumulibacter soli]
MLHQERTLTLLAVSDVHGRALEWDYLTDAPPAEPGSLARIATLLRQIRREDPAALLFDVGDTIEGTPLMSLAAREQHVPHPMATALNTLDVTAASVGNHEFNFGLDHLRRYAESCEFPLLAANITGAHGVCSRMTRTLELGEFGEVRVGVLGLSTPGSAIWDHAHLDGRVTVDGLVESAAEQVQALRADAADVVVVLSHAGLGPSSTYGDTLPWPENDTARLIREVPGIDAIFLGHQHVEKVGQLTCAATGTEVPYVEPLCFGRRLGRIDLRLRRGPDGRVKVLGGVPRSLPVAEVKPDAAFIAPLQAAHERTRAYTARRIGEAAEPIEAAPATIGPSAALDLVNVVQSTVVRRALRERGERPRRVLSVTALFAEHGGLGRGPISIRDVSRIYPFENELHAVELSGDDLLAYLEHNARGFGDWDVPAYNVDSLGSADHDVAYEIDPMAPVGSRISGLRIDGEPVRGDEHVVVAMSNYRASGGGGFPGTAGNPPLYNNQQRVRDLLIDWILERGTVHRSDLRPAAWQVR